MTEAIVRGVEIMVRAIEFGYCINDALAIGEATCMAAGGDLNEYRTELKAALKESCMEDIIAGRILG